MLHFFPLKKCEGYEIDFKKIPLFSLCQRLVFLVVSVVSLGHDSVIV